MKFRMKPKIQRVRGSLNLCSSWCTNSWLRTKLQSKRNPLVTELYLGQKKLSWKGFAFHFVVKIRFPISDSTDIYLCIIAEYNEVTKKSSGKLVTR